MDRKRYEEEGKEKKLKEIFLKSKIEENKKTEEVNYRLIQEYECPNWIHVDTFETKEDEDEIKYGKGMRKKANINYKDDNDDIDEESGEDSFLRKRKRDKNEDNYSSKKNRMDNEEEFSKLILIF